MFWSFSNFLVLSNAEIFASVYHFLSFIKCNCSEYFSPSLLHFYKLWEKVTLTRKWKKSSNIRK